MRDEGEQMDQGAEPSPAMAIRRQVLGDEYVDAQTDETDQILRQFQEYVTESAWGVWTREGPLSTRDRSLLVLAMTAALGRTEEFEIHVRASARAGVTQPELHELLFQIAAYAGVPAAVNAKRVMKRVLDEPGAT